MKIETWPVTKLTTREGNVETTYHYEIEFNQTKILTPGVSHELARRMLRGRARQILREQDVGSVDSRLLAAVQLANFCESNDIADMLDMFEMQFVSRLLPHFEKTYEDTGWLTGIVVASSVGELMEACEECGYDFNELISTVPDDAEPVMDEKAVLANMWRVLESKLEERRPNSGASVAQRLQTMFRSLVKRP